MIRIIFLIVLFLPGKAFAQDAADFGDHAMAGTVKAFARIFVATADLDKIKVRQIKTLTRMKETRFQERYAGLYVTLKDVPPELLLRFGLREHLSKQEAIKEIRRVDKDELMELISEMPDQAIVKYVKIYLRQEANQFKDQTSLQQIDSLWRKLIQKA